jgi:tetratricopeptide (TPR) repeat protein
MSISRVVLLAAALLLGNCPTDPARPRDREADALQARGAALSDSDQAEDALPLLSEALRRHLATGDHGGASTDASLLARTHRMANQFREALRLAELARGEAVLSGEREALASATLALGDTLEHVGDHPRALEVYEEAGRHLSSTDKVRRAHLAINSGSALIAMGRRREARTKLEEGRALAHEAGAHAMVVRASVNLSDIALTERRLDDAERDLRHAHAAQRIRNPRVLSAGAQLNEAVLARLRGDLPAAAAALDRIESTQPEDTRELIAGERGLIAEAQGDLDLAERSFQEAVDLVEQLRAHFTPEDARAPLLEERWAAYGNLFALRLRRGDARGAFATMALAQGRMFLDALAVSLAEAAGETPTRIDGAIGRLSRLERAMPVLERSKIGGTRSPDRTLASVRGKHILAYFPAGQRLRMLTVVDGEPRMTGVDVDLERLDRLIEDFWGHPDDARAAEELGRALLPPGSLPELPARVHIVPVGKLLTVSFAALRVSGQRVLDRYEIVYAPSVTGLAEMAAERDAAVGPGLVIADTRSDIEHAASESKMVAESTGATRKVGAEATIAALRAAASQPLLHVISHSGLGAGGGFLSLASGQVTAADIVAWRIRPHLVVLPTCASAATVRTEMWDSLAAAFLAAGSRHVVATVVSVEDRVAAEFTRHFYREGGARDPVRGVTRALREMAREHPVSAWSAFVVAGL